MVCCFFWSPGGGVSCEAMLLFSLFYDFEYGFERQLCVPVF